MTTQTEPRFPLSWPTVVQIVVATALLILTVYQWMR
jgi:hypothetical protein